MPEMSVIYKVMSSVTTKVMSSVTTYGAIVKKER